MNYKWVYQYILQDKRKGGDFYTYLRCKLNSKERYGSNERPGAIKNRNFNTITDKKLKCSIKKPNSLPKNKLNFRKPDGCSFRENQHV